EARRVPRRALRGEATMRRRGVLGALALLAAGSAVLAQDERPVQIELKTGEKVSGRLVGFESRRYRIKIGDATLGIREEDIRRIEFGEAPKPAESAPVAPASTASFTAADVIRSMPDVPGMKREKLEFHGPEDVRLERKLPESNGDVARTTFTALCDYASLTFTDRASIRVTVYRYPDTEHTEAPFA